MIASFSFLRRAAVPLLLSLAGCAAAETLPATPATLGAALARAKGGDVVRLAAGEDPVVTIQRRTFEPRLRIDASRARVAGWIVRDAGGVDLDGGVAGTEGSPLPAVTVQNARGVRVSNMLLTGSRSGVALTRSQDVAVVGNRLEGLRSDGVLIAMSQRVLVERNVCRGFRHRPATFAADGRMVRDGDHPDCIQGWSRLGDTPTGDVTIVGNVGEGYMQGVWFGDRGQGGYDRMVVRDNRFTLGMYHGIAMGEVRGAEVTGNVVRTTPGARSPKPPHQPMMTWIRVTGTDLKVCGNEVETDRLREGTKRCPKPKRRG